MRKTLRCIVIVRGQRCPRRPVKRTGDLFVCAQHSGPITMLLIDDALAPATRRMLACSRWETFAEGQRLINVMYRRTAA
jgi:hypothetical protein